MSSVLLFQAVGLGFTAGVLPGPLQTFALVQSLQGGVRRGLWVALAPLLSDGPVIVICLGVLSQVGDGWLRIVAVAGALFLLHTALATARGLRGPATPLVGQPDVGAVPSSGWSVLGRAALVNALGPGAWVFWSTVLGPLLVGVWRDSAVEAGLFLGGFYGTFVVTLGVQVTLFSFARRLGGRVVRVGSWLGVGLLVVFAFSLAWYAVRGGTG